ncbi:MAG: hypothetical protein AAGF93_11670 [Cyanobacteria bacterium P01_H01_bin.105]
MLVLISLLIPLIALPSSGWAADTQGNQAIQQSATLRASKPDQKIAIYPQPSTRKRRIGYGINGDAVIVLETVGSNKGIIWDHIRFDNPPYANGWVQEEFLMRQTPTDKNQSVFHQSSGNQYLGGQ